MLAISKVGNVQMMNFFAMRAMKDLNFTLNDALLFINTSGKVSVVPWTTQNCGGWGLQ